MQKYIFMLFSCLICIGGAYGFNICKHTGTFVGAYQFQKSVNGTINTVDATTKQWAVQYSYGVVTGNAACNGVAGTVGVPNTALITKASDVGNYCWCQMFPIKSLSPMSPLSSYWVYLGGDYELVEDCTPGCTQLCAKAMAENADFRTAIFTSIW